MHKFSFHFRRIEKACGHFEFRKELTTPDCRGSFIPGPDLTLHIRVVEACRYLGQWPPVHVSAPDINVLPIHYPEWGTESSSCKGCHINKVNLRIWETHKKSSLSMQRGKGSRELWISASWPWTVWLTCGQSEQAGSLRGKGSDSKSVRYFCTFMAFLIFIVKFGSHERSYDVCWTKVVARR